MSFFIQHDAENFLDEILPGFVILEQEMREKEKRMGLFYSEVCFTIDIDDTL